ncbi:MAG: hypothetical protein HFE75_06725 [Firmicutes bacterium]|jgi:hypothetical protein|nr:hypothetical protein [Bacillota bacterium]
MENAALDLHRIARDSPRQAVCVACLLVSQAGSILFYYCLFIRKGGKTGYEKRFPAFAPLFFGSFL